MKYKTTRKAILNNGGKIRRADYCELQYLLQYHEPQAYTSGVYGWNFDVYHVYGLTICTGYRGMPGDDLKHVTEYENKARAIYNDHNIPHGQRKADIETLLKEFCILNGGRE